jgi:hypothetical protein
MGAAYTVQRYSLDEACPRDCAFLPAEEKQINPASDGSYAEVFALKPYSVTLFVLKPAPPPLVQEVTGKTETPLPPASAGIEPPVTGNGGNVTVGNVTEKH